MNADKTYLDSLSEKVLGAVFEVSNTPGAGFLERVYQRALLRELQNGLPTNTRHNVSTNCGPPAGRCAFW
jgi:GxxExxY protein